MPFVKIVTYIRIFHYKEFLCWKLVIFILILRHATSKTKTGILGSGLTIFKFPGSLENREINKRYWRGKKNSTNFLKRLKITCLRWSFIIPSLQKVISSIWQKWFETIEFTHWLSLTKQIKHFLGFMLRSVSFRCLQIL